jgi:hypothetical protein
MLCEMSANDKCVPFDTERICAAAKAISPRAQRDHESPRIVRVADLPAFTGVFPLKAIGGLWPAVPRAGRGATGGFDAWNPTRSRMLAPLTNRGGDRFVRPSLEPYGGSMNNEKEQREGGPP